MKFLVESAHEDNAPEPLDGAFRLAAAAEPLQHGDPAVFLEVRRLTLGAQNIEHRAPDGELVQERQRREGRERRAQMKWRGQEPGLHLSFAALRIEKEEPVEELDFAGGADARVEIVEICAASQSDVLTVVHMLAVGQHVGRCAAAKKGTLFKQTNTPAGFSQRDARRQSR